MYIYIYIYIYYPLLCVRTFFLFVWHLGKKSEENEDGDAAVTGVGIDPRVNYRLGNTSVRNCPCPTNTHTSGFLLHSTSTRDVLLKFVQDLSSFLRQMRLASHVLLRILYRILEKYTRGLALGGGEQSLWCCRKSCNGRCDLLRVAVHNHAQESIVFVGQQQLSSFVPRSQGKSADSQGAGLKTGLSAACPLSVGYLELTSHLQRLQP